MNEFLAKLPSTNARIVVTLCLVSLTVVVVLGGLVLGRPLNLEVLIALFTFEAALLGVDYAQFAKKRDTYQPSPPAPPDIEDAKAVKPESEIGT